VIAQGDLVLSPGIDGASSTQEWKDALWAKFFTGAPRRQRWCVGAIHHSQESLRGLARRYGVNPKTVAKWKARSSVADKKAGPKKPGSTVLSSGEEAAIVAFRRYTLLPLDDCLYAPQPIIPHLTQSSWYRCLQRYGISRLPDIEGTKPARKKVQAPHRRVSVTCAERR